MSIKIVGFCRNGQIAILKFKLMGSKSRPQPEYISGFTGFFGFAMLNSFVLYKDSVDKLIIQVQAKTYKKESGGAFHCAAAAGAKKSSSDRSSEELLYIKRYK